MRNDVVLTSALLRALRGRLHRALPVEGATRAPVIAGQIKLTQALLVVVLPVAALLLVISLLFKVVWMLEG